MVGTLIAFLALLAAGHHFIRSVVPGRDWPLQLALTHLCGSAALAMGVTLGLVITNQVGVGWGVLGLAGLTLAGFLRSSRADEPATGGHRVPLTRGEWVLVLLLAMGVATALARVVLLPLDWDGWAIWQFKARAMVAGGLREQLTTPKFGYSHPDYPLLIPTSTWWLCAGNFQPKIAQVSGFLFFLDLLVLFYYWARRYTSRALALVGCVLLVSWPLVMKHTASGFADVPMAAYVLAAAVYLGEGQMRLGFLGLTGALLTKNEGLFTLLGAGLVLLNGCLGGGAVDVSGTDRRTRLGWLRAVAVLGGGVLVAAAWAVMKRRWSLYADLLDPSRWPKDMVSTLLHRIPGIVRGFIREAVGVGPRYPGWGLFWPVALLALPGCIRLRLRASWPLLLMCAGHLIGIVVAYLVTPFDVTLHMSRSVDRLLLHFAPTLLLATLIALEAWGNRRDPAV